MSQTIITICILPQAMETTLPSMPLAYIGPGTGLSAIGTFLALLAGVLVALLGFFWYPLKRLFGRKKSQEPDAVTEGREDT